VGVHGEVLAGALLASIPVVVVNGLLMDCYIGGLVTGATKY
jgi:ABC-type glycerol-3-phosphate transport system permease component